MTVPSERLYESAEEIDLGELTQGELEILFGNIADAAGGELRRGYAGRGMWGRRCFGITGCGVRILERAGSFGVFEAQMDSMGAQQVVYWPQAECPDMERDDAEISA